MATQPNDETLEDAFEEQQADDQQQQTDGEALELTEDLALRMGWKPKDEFAGAPEEWNDWKEWLEVEHRPQSQLRHRNKVLTRKLDQEARRNKAIELTLENLKGFVARSEQRGYERALADLREQQRTAVADADPDAYDRASEQIDRLETERKQEEAAPQVNPAASQAFNRWRAKGGWYGKEPLKTAAMDAVCADMGMYRDLGMDPDEYLTIAEERAMKEYPRAFPDVMQANGAAPRRPSAVGAVTETRGARNAETYDNLPADAKAQFRRFEQMGMPIKKDDFARDAWQVIKAEKRQ